MKEKDDIMNFTINNVSVEDMVKPEAVARVTKRELQCLLMAANDMTMKETARELLISVETVRRHRSNMLEKLGCKSLIGAYKKVLNRELVGFGA